MTFRLLERIEGWSARLYGLDLERLRREQALRAGVLRELLFATGFVALLYLVLGFAGVVSGRYFPYDAVELLLAVTVCAWLLRRGHTATALVIPLVIYSHSASSIIVHYGVDSPAVAVLMPTIIVCGLLVGGYFLGTWTFICGVLVLFLGSAQGNASRQTGWVHPILFWWTLFAAEGWLVHLFSRHLERLLQLERAQKHTVLRTLGVLASDPDLDGVVERMLDLVREQLGATAVEIWRWEGADTFSRKTRRGASPRPPIPIFVPAARAQTSFTEHRIAGRVKRQQSERRTTESLDVTPEDCFEFISVPLVAGTVFTGVLAVGSDNPPPRGEERLELAEALALQVSLLLELVRLAQVARQTMMVEERNRIAREIHDTLAQGFTGIVVQLNAAEATLTANPAKAAEHITTARELARTSLQEARRSVWALRPESLERECLAKSLERSARALIAGAATELVIETTGVIHSLGIEPEWEVLRIGQEAVTNAVRHSGCQRITLRLDQRPDVLRLEIEDDGKGGINPATAASTSNGFGLVGMRERAERISGRIEIQSPDGGPTRVTLVVPRK